MKIEEHQKAYREHLEHVKKTVEEGLEENQRNIGFNVSQGATELFSIYLHSLKIIQGSGDQFGHRMFKSKNLLKKRLPQQFPSKEEILKIMEEIEQERNVLCYGARKPSERIEKIIRSFYKLREVINRRLKDASRKR